LGQAVVSRRRESSSLSGYACGLTTGEQVLRFGEHLWAVPMHALWGE
jgi:hypothetical protein